MLWFSAKEVNFVWVNKGFCCLKVEIKNLLVGGQLGNEVYILHASSVATSPVPREWYITTDSTCFIHFGSFTDT